MRDEGLTNIVCVKHKGPVLFIYSSRTQNLWIYVGTREVHFSRRGRVWVQYQLCARWRQLKVGGPWCGRVAPWIMYRAWGSWIGNT